MKKAIKLTFAFCLIGSLILCGAKNYKSFNVDNNDFLKAENGDSNKELKDGDIVFQTSKSSQSKAIQLATGSKYSHMGIIYKKDSSYFVYEAVQPVKLTPLNEWINRGE